MAHPDVTPALTDSETLEEVVSCLTEYIPISTQGNCDQQTIFEILVRAALFIEIVWKIPVKP